MKNILIILLTIISLTSCSNSPIKIEESNRAKETNEQLIIDACNDLTLYKIVVKDDVLYAISDEDDLVSYKVTNESGLVEFLMGMLICFTIIIIVFSMLI